MAVKRRNRRELYSLKRRSNRRRNRRFTLPAELVDEILVRLPVKPIIRFESVSKEWQSRIHSTSFKELYGKRTNKNESESKTMKLEDLYKMAPELQHEPSGYGGEHPGTKISAIGPLSNGIYCLTSLAMHESSGWPRSLQRWPCKIALCNPGIRHFKFLPPFATQFCPELTLASFCGNRRVVCGFDRSPCCLDYRVVFIINYTGNPFDSFDSFLVFVYSSNSGEWEKLVDYKPRREPVGPPSAIRAFTRQIKHIVAPMEICSQKSLNGCWHWMVHLQEDGRPVILSFDFAHQSFSLIVGLPIGYHRSACEDVFVLRNHLAVIQRRLNIEGMSIEVSVWVLMDYNVQESWTLKFRACIGHGHVLALYGIDYFDLQGDVEEEGGFDDVFIKRLFFTCGEHSCKNKIISLDHLGGHQVTPLLYHPNEYINFSSGGISSYEETLERLY